MIETTECLLISGASSGIGRALAQRLSRGRKLILHGRDMPRLNETASLCEDPQSHLLWPFDLRDPHGAAESLGSLMAANGVTVHSFVHSAGLLRVLPIRSMDHAAFTETMNVNVASAVQIVSLLSKKRINRGSLKNVLFVSSIASQFGAPGFSAYSASKSALDGLMRALAIEMAPSVRVNSILPGGIPTPMTEGMLAAPEMLEKFTRDYPLGLGRCEDIVNAAEFLLSESARWITGHQMVIDGGRSVNISV